MSRGVPLSVAVITLNEEANIARCLESVGWADERLVVDCGSEDRTLEIAAELGARVEVEPWRGYAAQKNFALGLCSRPWVLSLDADEWLTAEGAEEIRHALSDPQADGYVINRSNRFCGRVLRYAWSPDWQLRMFRRGAGKFVGGRVHESVRLSPGASVSRLRCSLQHEPYRTIGQYVDRMNHYTDLAALSLHEQGRTAKMRQLLVSPWMGFLRVYVLKRGFLDGVRGWVVAAGAAFYVLLKYAKLWALCRSGRVGGGPRDGA
jgi:glycosyltransferase involved in cell wall biosynthesis